MFLVPFYITRSLRLLAKRAAKASCPPPLTLFLIEAYDVIVTLVTSAFCLWRHRGSRWSPPRRRRWRLWRRGEWLDRGSAGQVVVLGPKWVRASHWFAFKTTHSKSPHVTLAPFNRDMPKRHSAENLGGSKKRDHGLSAAMLILERFLNIKRIIPKRHNWEKKTIVRLCQYTWGFFPPSLLFAWVEHILFYI